MAAETGRSNDFAHLAQLVRAHDRPRYYATLFASAQHRTHLLALYAFAAEIARIPDLVSESGLGEMRLQWWREALATAAYASEAAQSPTLQALGETISKHHLPLAPFVALTESRSADLYSDPPATVGDLEGRLGETESSLFQMAAIVMGADAFETAEAAGHAGVAYGLARRLSVFAADRARGRSIVPSEALAARDIVPAEVFTAERATGLPEAIADMVDLAERHLVDARRQIAVLPGGSRLAFLPLAVVPSLLGSVRAAGADILVRPVGLSDLRMLSSIGWARLHGLGRPR